jgi:hypothetical protein
VHRRKPTLHIPLPAPDAGWITNSVVVLGLLAVCVAVGFLTDWRWGLLCGGLLAVAGGVYVQRNLAAVEPAAVVETVARPTPLRGGKAG